MVEQSVQAIAALCVDMVAILDLEQVVLGGSIGELGWYCDRVAAEISQQPELFRSPISTAALGQSSVLLGALIQRR